MLLCQLRKEYNMTTFSNHDLKVGNHLYFERGELIDDALFAEMNNLTFPLAKSNRLAEISEQIRLIENITAENQADYFDEQSKQIKGYYGKVEVTASAEWRKRHLN